MNFYIDTSVIAAFYCPEPLSIAADRLLTSTSEPSLSLLTEVELHSAIARKVRMGEMETAVARKVLNAFRSHLEMGYYRSIALRREHYEDARDRIASFAVPLRSLDALHLAVTLAEGLTMVTADTSLARAIETFGGDAHLLSA